GGGDQRVAGPAGRGTATVAALHRGRGTRTAVAGGVDPGAGRSGRAAPGRRLRPGGAGRRRHRVGTVVGADRRPARAVQIGRRRTPVGRPDRSGVGRTGGGGAAATGRTVGAAADPDPVVTGVGGTR